jgi:hypothetical protein
LIKELQYDIPIDGGIANIYYDVSKKDLSVEWSTVTQYAELKPANNWFSGVIIYATEDFECFISHPYKQGMHTASIKGGIGVNHFIFPLTEHKVKIQSDVSGKFNTTYYCITPRPIALNNRIFLQTVYHQPPLNLDLSRLTILRGTPTQFKED